MKLHKRLIQTVLLGGQFFKTTLQIIYGYWRISRLAQPCISIFGSSRIQDDSHYSRLTYSIASQLAQSNISVLTGGGPGVMRAATCGAAHAGSGKHHVMGISTSYLIKTEPLNSCIGKFSIIVNTYLARKWLLVYYSAGFIMLPGGTGTLDEFSGIFVLMDVGEIPPGPIILIGKEFWQPFVDWLDTSTNSGLIRAEARKFVTLTDDPDEAIALLKKHCAR